MPISNVHTFDIDLVSHVIADLKHGNAGNVFTYTQGRSDQNADWLCAYGRTAKIGYDPIATERRLRCNDRWQRQRRN